MKQTLGKLTGKLVTLISMGLGLAERQTDHRKLTRHILELSKKQSSIEIINEAALCLKDLLRYRLFAFVIKKEDGVDIWLDPRVYKKSLEDIILKDFSLEDRNDLNYLNHVFDKNEPEDRFNMDDLVFYELGEENCRSRIYMLPHKPPCSYQDEIVALIFQGCSAALSRLLKIEKLRNAAVVDPLTGCYNRRELETQLNRTISGAVRHKSKLSVFMFDLDHFKKVNDTYGHLAGDKVLTEISALVRKNMRSGDILARYGGEEFFAILPETGRIKAMELADRLRVKISRMKIVHNDQIIRVTASFGVSELNRYSDMSKIMQDADTMLYRAKLNGRNTVMPGLIKVVPDMRSSEIRHQTV